MSRLLPPHRSTPIVPEVVPPTTVPVTIVDTYERGTLAEALEPVRRHYVAILIVTAVCGLTAFLLTFLQAPVFQARALLYVHPPDERLATMSGDTPGEWSDKPEAYMETQAAILKSDSLIGRVITSLAAQQPPGETATWRTRVGIAHAPAPLGVSDARRRLGVSLAPLSRTLEIRFDASDPAYAAAVVNGLAAELGHEATAMRRQSAEASEAWLVTQLEREKVALQKSEDALQDFAKTLGLAATGEGDSVESERLRQLQAELSKAQAERVVKQSQFEVAAASPVESLPQVLENHNLSEYQSKIAELKRQLAELKTSLTPTNYRVQKVEAQLAELQTALEAERASVVRGIRVDRETAERRERLLANAFTEQAAVVSDLGAKATRYNVLKRELETERRIYDSMLQKTKEAGMASALRQSTIHVIDPATSPQAPYKPARTMSLAVGCVAGFLLAFVGVVLYEATDKRIRRPGEAPAVSGARELGVLPYERTFEDGDTGGARLAQSVVWMSAHGSGRNLLNSLRSSVVPALLSGGGRPRARAVVISSPEAGDGKSTVAVNLALALSSRSRRVLLVDANSCNPQLARRFGISHKYGFANLLAAPHPIDECPDEFLGFETSRPGLFVLPLGHGETHLAETLYSDRLPLLIERLYERFDVILIDTPPVLEMPEARMLGQLTDGVVLTVSAGHTTTDILKQAVSVLHADGVPLLGTVLNLKEAGLRA